MEKEQNCGEKRQIKEADENQKGRPCPGLCRRPNIGVPATTEDHHSGKMRGQLSQRSGLPCPSKGPKAEADNIDNFGESGRKVII